MDDLATGPKMGLLKFVSIASMACATVVIGSVVFRTLRVVIADSAAIAIAAMVVL